MSEPKQHMEEFESCVSQVMKQGHEKSSAFAICTKSFQDAGKPIFVGESERQKLHLFCESFKIEGNKVSGVAIHPKRIFHPEEDMTHVYLKEELEKAAPTLAGKPFGIDHMYILPPPNLITNSWYCPEHDGVCFEGIVDDHIAEQIRKKAFKGISIELDWLRPGGSVEYVNGVAAKNFELTSLHLLHRFPPGDPDAFVKLWERVREQLVVGPPLPLDQRVEALEQQIQELLNQINVINAKLEVLTGQGSPSATAPPAQLGASQTIGVMKMKEAEWDTEYINNLPDSAFAYIEPGGEKDEQGKTTPRDLRHLPFKNAEGNIDHDHLVNALARLPQTELSDDAKAQAKKKLCSAVSSWNEEHSDNPIESDVCGTTDTTGTAGTTGEAMREQQGNQEEPELDAHGCKIGKEHYDEEQDKCVPITAEARVAFLEAKLSLKEQEGELSVDEIKQKIADLTKQKEELDQKLYPESELSEEEKATVRAQLEQLYAEIQAYEQALAAKVAGQAAPPETTPPELKEVKETIVALRKKLNDAEAKLIDIEKQRKREAASWKEKYEKLYETVKGAIPPPRIWKSWTPGPQRYVQENLKILRESES